MSRTFSVVLATHNGERFLEEQLDSLLAQTHPPHEIVISDDNSSDRTPEILDAFEARSHVPTLRISNVPGLGFRDNFVRAALRASGDWIAFCDQDDIWRPDKLQVCASYVDDPRVTQIVHTAELVDSRGQRIGSFRQGISKTGHRSPLHYDVWRTFYGFSLVFRRALLDLVASEARFVDYIAPSHSIAHDRWVFFLAQVLGQTVEIATPLVKYRQHEHNVYGAKRRLRLEGRRTVREKNLPYIQAAAAMVDIIERLPDEAETIFPTFDRAAALRAYRAAHAQVSARGTVYEAGRVRGMARVLSNLAAGAYRKVEGGGQRWRSVTKDLLHCVSF